MNEYSMLIVDDERLVREYVTNLLDWSRLGVQKLYDADCCEAALEIIKEQSIDIIFLDIWMPEMSGVELLFVLQEKNIDAEVIMLSGYSDFEAARKMLKTGKVVEYLLKPVSEDLAVEAVLTAISNIEKKRELAKMKGVLGNVIEKEKKRKLQSYIFGYPYEADNNYDLDITFLSMQIAVVFCDAGYDVIKDLCSDMITYKLNHLLDIIKCDQPNYFALLFASDKPDMQNETYNICKFICEKTNGICGIGRQYSNIFDLNTSYRQAFFACESRLFVNSQIIRIDDITKQFKGDLDKEDLVKKMKKHIQAGDFKKIDDLIKLILQSVLFEVSNDESIMNYDLGIAKAYFVSFLESIMTDRNSSYNLSNLLSAKSINDLFSMIRDTLYQSCGYYSQDKASHKTKLISEVKQFVFENYMMQITLNQAADVVFLNPSYLSRLFSEVEGYGFSEYVAKVRIAEAKRQLSDRKLKIFEVAEMVGYKSFKYFLKIFKEKEGITPAQYREKSIFVKNK